MRLPRPKSAPKRRLTKKAIHATKGGGLAKTAKLFTVVTDTREQVPWDLAPFRQERGTLKTGDYELLEAPGLICLERKGCGLSDLLHCIGGERNRFEAELIRLTGFRFKFVIVEGSWKDLCTGSYRSTVPAAAAMGSIAKWQVEFGIPFLFCDSRGAAEAMAIRLLVQACRYWGSPPHPFPE